ncbi:hypothetical protein PGTUg99_005632 [Puccinia graminis f. sp. tritici]|uniref:Uncharacterized protein n=1 Tax=Puccinia graminis f. sp. tritici TaxID=56615 RepID=A0A5B0RJC6_PUCGR|nr:hypothetical protein PGTUg99_005632 [Puccinia graminis f. sp. tritici]
MVEPMRPTILPRSATTNYVHQDPSSEVPVEYVNGHFSPREPRFGFTGRPVEVTGICTQTLHFYFRDQSFRQK